MKFDGNVKGIATQIEAKVTQVETIIATEVTSLPTALIAEAMNSQATGQEGRLLQVTAQN